MGVLFGLLAAATYGVADFVGGRVSRRVDVFSVVLVSQLIGVVPLLIALPFLAEDAPTARGFIWGGAAGLAGATGVVLLYRGLAVGRMSVVAPITGVIAASVPVVVGIALGERPTEISLVGVGIALVSVVLVSSAPPPDDEHDVALTDHVGSRKAGVALGVGAGTCFALFFVFLNATGEDTAAWPLVATRASSLVFIASTTLALKRPIKPPPGTIVAIGAAGILDVAANLFYLVSTRFGLLSLVAVLTSMYPAVTVLMARVFLHERMVRSQLAGLALAGGAIVMIVLG